MFFHIYSKRNQKIIRIICILAELVLSLGITMNLMKGFTSPYRIFIFVQNCIVGLLILILFIFPTKITLIAIIAYQYSITYLITEPLEVMGLFMFLLSLSVLFVRGFFRTNRNLKLFLICLPFVAAHLSEIRFGINTFIFSTIERIGVLFVISLILFFFYVYLQNKSYSNSKKLNLANFPALNKRDAEWLCAILQNKKYDWIAIEYKMSTGSIKNRLKTVFNILEVGDRIGF